MPTLPMPNNGNPPPLPPFKDSPVMGGPVISHAPAPSKMKTQPTRSRRWGGFDFVALIFSGLAVLAGAMAFLRSSQTYSIVAQLQRAQTNQAGAIDVGDGAAAPTGPVDIAFDSHVPFVGNTDAKVTVVEFSDFQCPFCNQFSQTTKKIRKSYTPDQVKFVYMHFPLSNIHPNAEPAATAAQCVMDLAGSAAFFEYHDQLFVHQAELGDELYYKLADQTEGLDQAQFDECYKNKQSLSEVQADFDLGLQVGVDGTPATFVNGNRVEGGAVSFDKIKAIIDSELKK
ncbi:MAG: DsbA family protein [Candidatus Andersenbacteria bacterium]